MELYSFMQKDFKSIRYNVTIKIEGGYVIFYKTEDLIRHCNWLESLNDYELEELSNDEKICNDFYWLCADEWISDYKTTRQEPERTDNWHRHIKTKNWFTDEMYNWINKQLIK